MSSEKDTPPIPPNSKRLREINGLGLCLEIDGLTHPLSDGLKPAFAAEALAAWWEEMRAPACLTYAEWDNVDDCMEAWFKWRDGKDWH